MLTHLSHLSPWQCRMDDLALTSTQTRKALKRNIHSKHKHCQVPFRSLQSRTRSYEQMHPRFSLIPEKPCTCNPRSSKGRYLSLFYVTSRRGGCGIAICFCPAVRLTQIPLRGLDCHPCSLLLTHFGIGYGEMVLDLHLPLCLQHCRLVHTSKPTQAKLGR